MLDIYCDAKPIGSASFHSIRSFIAAANFNHTTLESHGASEFSSPGIFITSLCGPPHPGDQDKLQGQTKPEQDSRNRCKFLAVKRHLQVGGKHRDQEGNQPITGKSTKRRNENPNTTQHLTNPADIDQRQFVRQPGWHYVQVNGGPNKMKNAGYNKEHSQQHNGRLPEHR